VNILISTCGTSILTNLDRAKGREWLHRMTNDPVPTDEAYDFVAKIETEFQTLTGNALHRASAELAAIGAIRPRLSGPIHHLLVHSDTFFGEETAKMVQTNLRQQGEVAQLVGATGLRTNDLSAFRAAVPALTSTLVDQWLLPFPERNHRVVFNLTGGFKALLAYLQTLALLHGRDSFVLFEGSSEPMLIPALPICLDRDLLLQRDATLFRRMQAGFDVETADYPNMPIALTEPHGRHVKLSAWGEAVWSSLKEQALGHRPAEPLVPQLRVDKELANSFSGFPLVRRIQTNEALDRFSHYLHRRIVDGNLSYQLPDSTALKQFTSPQEPGMTHELYAWNDGDAGRVLLRKEGDTYVAFKLRKHLR
jgi:putative CRISPR-associated protein (TIGR02619 family)